MPEVTFMPQTGRSDPVCSSAIYIKDAILKANELTKVLRDVLEQSDVIPTQAPVELID